MYFKSSDGEDAGSKVGDLERSYRVLGLEPGASEQEVKEAYRDLTKVWHPDRFSDKDSRLKEKAEARTKELNEAYRNISASGFKSPEPEEPEPRPLDREEEAAPKPQPTLSGWFVKALVVFFLVLVAVVVAAGIVGDKLNEFLDRRLSAKNGLSSVDGLFKAFRTGLTGLDEKAEADKKDPPVPIGITRDEVVAILGAPDKIERSNFGELWWYNKSFVHFMRGTVMAYSDQGDLRARPSGAPKAKETPKAASKAKKLYQYRDEKGRIYITDKPKSR